jgi:hypothetical protein
VGQGLAALLCLLVQVEHLPSQLTVPCDLHDQVWLLW